MQTGSLVEWNGSHQNHIGGETIPSGVALVKGEIYTVTSVHRRDNYNQPIFVNLAEKNSQWDYGIELLNEVQPPGEVNISELLKAPVGLEPA